KFRCRSANMLANVPQSHTTTRRAESRAERASSGSSLRLLASVQFLPRRARNLRRQLRGRRRRQVFDQLRVDAAALDEFRFGVVAHALDQQHEFALALVGVGGDAGVELAEGT